MIIFIILLCICLFIFVKWRYINTSIIKKYFNKLSIVVCGKRGKGKDTLMSYIAYKKPHNCNFMLQNNTNLIKLNELIIPNISREKLVNGTFTPIERDKYKKFDNITFISDCQLYFPNYEDSILKKEYKELPIVWATWRHLYNSGLHWNTQNFERLWKVMREQIDDTIMCLECVRGMIYTKLKVRYYERGKDAIEGLKPLKHNLFHTPTEKEIELSKRWLIKDFTLLIPNRMINHDTHYFHRVIFGKKKGE